MKNQIIAAGRELKPFFIPGVPGPRLWAPPWERCVSHPSLWPAITGEDYSCNSPLIGAGAAINARRSARLPSRGCRQRRPRRPVRGSGHGQPAFGLLPLAPARALNSGASPPPRSHLRSTPQAPTHPAVPHCSATSSGKPARMAPSWEDGLLYAHLSVSGLSSFCQKMGCQQDIPQRAVVRTRC